MVTVLIREPLTKLSRLPMALVKDITENSLGDVTSALLFKGDSRETISRHVSFLIPLLSAEKCVQFKSVESDEGSSENPSDTDLGARPKRASNYTNHVDTRTSTKLSSSRQLPNSQEQTGRSMVSTPSSIC